MGRIEGSGAVNPDQGIVLNESTTPTHPLVRGRRRAIPTAWEIAETPNGEGQPVFDRVVFLSVSRMDTGE